MPFTWGFPSETVVRTPGSVSSEESPWSCVLYPQHHVAFKTMELGKVTEVMNISRRQRSSEEESEEDKC